MLFPVAVLVILYTGLMALSAVAACRGQVTLPALEETSLVTFVPVFCVCARSLLGALVRGSR